MALSSLASGGIMAGANLVIGGVTALINKQQQKKMSAEVEKMINSTPDFRSSEAYGTAATEAGKADRYAQEGLTSQQMLMATQGTDRSASAVMENAGDVGAALQGGRLAQQTLADSYQGIATADAEAQLANRGLAANANKNLQSAQEEAYNIDLGKQQNLIDLKLGNMESSRETINNLASTANNSVQNMISADGWKPAGPTGEMSGGSQDRPNTAFKVDPNQVGNLANDPMDNGARALNFTSPSYWKNGSTLQNSTPGGYQGRVKGDGRGNTWSPRYGTEDPQSLIQNIAPNNF